MGFLLKESWIILEFDGKMVNVVDYKTGDPEKAAEKISWSHCKKSIGW